MELQQLLKECKNGSLTAQKYLYDQYAAVMFLLCRRYVKTDECAEEVMMTGFLKFFQSLSTFKYVNDAATFGWMKKIMINECLMQIRSSTSFLQVATEQVPDVCLDEDIVSRMSATEILELITQLPTGYRTVFNLYEIESLSHKEIAKLLDITEGTSKSQLSKAKNLLQQMLIKQDASYAHRKSK